MKILGVETSSPLFSVALSDGPEVRIFRKEEGQGPPSLLLADMIQQALQEAKWEIRNLDGFAVSIGPGSFTGLRIGAMTVKALAWALSKPVLPVSSLEVIAHNLSDSRLPVVPFLDAKKGNVYTASFVPDGGGFLRRAAPDERLCLEEVLRRFERPAVLVGDGLPRYAEQVSSLPPAGLQQAPPEFWAPRADRLCRIAASRWLAGLLDDPHRLVPEYLYP